VLRKPNSADAASVFSRYANDPVVTKYLAWPRHQSLADTQAFLAYSDAEWQRSMSGPYLIESRVEQHLLGSTGLAYETPTVALTGYVLAKDAWGKGYATEALSAIVELAGTAGIRRLYALCHPDNRASVHVLEKCGFLLEDLLKGYAHFPNLGLDEPQDCLRYARTYS
jgi:RimJ/RimL family protein N-acetyltransferase